MTCAIHPNKSRYPTRAAAMRKGLVAVVDKSLGPAPTHVYDYDMQMPWIIRARQWVADQRRPPAVFPIHCWSAGYGGPQTPMTWFRCTTCGGTDLGQPHAKPDRPCLMCVMDGHDTDWEVADESRAFASTLRASEGMSSDSVAKVMGGPRRRLDG